MPTPGGSGYEETTPMSGFEEFKWRLAKAMGADEAAEAVAVAADQGVDIDGDPKVEIEAQAKAIAEAIKTYLISLDDAGYLKRPGGS